MSLFRLSLKSMVANAWQTLLRFPFTLLCAFLGTICMWQQIDAARDDAFRHTYTKLILTSILGLILFFAFEITAERRENKPALRYGLIGVGLVILIGYFVSLPAILPTKETIRYLLLLLGLHLTASFAAFLNRLVENGFWQFNKSLFLRLLTSALYSGVLYIGLALAILAVEELFNVEVDPNIFWKLWVGMLGIFNTWFFLAGVPNPTVLEQETDYPKGLKLFTQFVLLPLVTLYLIILYAYMGKIPIQWDWPRGWVSYLVLGFSTAGIFSLLLIHPIRNSEGNRWIRTYAKWFYRALFPLLVLLLLAIWRRVRDYGITENRYLVLALALWLLVVAIYFLVSKQKNIKFIPMTLTVMVFLSAFGPWGAFNVSERDQTQRLEKLLKANGLLVNGKIKKAKEAVSIKEEGDISSIVEYLGEMHQYASIRPWFGAQLDTLFEKNPEYGDGTPSASEVGNLIGLRLGVSRTASDENEIYYNAISAEVELIKGYDYLIEYSVNTRVDEQISQEFIIENKLLHIKVSSKRNDLQFIFSGETLQFPLDTLITLAKQGDTRRKNAKEATFQLKGNHNDVELRFSHLEAVRKQDSYHVQDLEAKVFIKSK